MDSTSVVKGAAVPVSHMDLGGVARIPAVRQVILLIGIAASVAVGVAIVLWSQVPEYSQLYGDLDAADAAQVTEALRGADIKYKLNTETGAVMVPESRLHDARLELASQGLPQGAAAGMNMMQEQSSFGVSQFMESARYQHALETELARTIASLGAVRDARVHLALPKQSAFIRDQKGASASVLLQLQRGRQLETDQSSAIVHLVASSVPNLVVNNVTVIDQHGRLLSSGDEPYNDALTSSQFKYARRLEETYKRRIEELLTPLVGPGRVRAQVVADLDFTVTEETRESFDPAKTTVRSEQISEEQRRGNQSEARGVPGALSNQPPQTATDAGASASAAAGGDPINSARTSTRNFEVDRTISHTRPQSGTIRRLSVAVLVDDSTMPGATSSEQPALTDAEVQRFKALVKESVGFNEIRGDTIVVVSAAFRSLPEIAAAEEPKIWEQPILRDITKLILGAGLVLALAFGLIRPMLRGVLANDAPISAQYLGGGSSVVMPAGTPQLPGAAAAAIPAPNYDDKVAAAKNITGHDPARVAQVVAKWVTADG